MKRMDNFLRVKRLMESAISDLSLRLGGISVLTEAASGAFAVTPLIAALSGADAVIAVTRDSEYGSASEVKEYIESWAENLGVAGRIHVTTQPAYMHAHSVDLVTNLGFVRPLDERLINLLPSDAAIALMWETWEFRAEDVDLGACRRRGIPVLGTCETHPRLQIFRYVGLVVLKLLLEANIEVFNSHILLVGSGPFGQETKQVLEANGALLFHLDPVENWGPDSWDLKHVAKDVDAIVLTEHRAKFTLLGGKTGLPLEWFDGSGVVIIHLCGKVEEEALAQKGLRKIPARRVEPGFMAVATDYVGPRPVIDLHAGGLKVGEALVRGMRSFHNANQAVQYALSNSPAMDFEEE